MFKLNKFVLNVDAACVVVEQQIRTKHNRCLLIKWRTTNIYSYIVGNGRRGERLLERDVNDGKKSALTAILYNWILIAYVIYKLLHTKKKSPFTIILHLRICSKAFYAYLHSELGWLSSGFCNTDSFSKQLSSHIQTEEKKLTVSIIMMQWMP